MPDKLKMLPGRPEDVTFGQKKSEHAFFWYILRKNSKALLFTLIGIFSVLIVLLLFLIGIELFSPKMTWSNQQKIENLEKATTEQGEKIKDLRDEIETLQGNNENLQTELRSAKQESNTLRGTVAARDKQIEKLLDKTSFQTLEEEISNKVTWWGCFFATLLAVVCVLTVGVLLGEHIGNFFDWFKSKIRRL